MSWQPPTELPDLRRIKEVAFDSETNVSVRSTQMSREP